MKIQKIGNLKPKSKCPNCNHKNFIYKYLDKWSSGGFVPVSCTKCGTYYIQDVIYESFHIGESQNTDNTDNATLSIGSIITLNNKEHKLHGFKATIIDKSFNSYRLEFKCGLRLWVPYDWTKDFVT